MERTIAVNVSTIMKFVGEMTSVVFNPHDDCFYGCNTISNSITVIKGSECSQFHRFENNLVPKAIDYYINGRYFIIVLDGPTPTVYKKPMDGEGVIIVSRLSRGGDYDYPTGVSINQKNGDAFISSQNGSIHKLSAEGELTTLMPKIKEATFRHKGLQSILYEHEKDTLLVCNAGNNRIFELNLNTGKQTIFCKVSDPFQIIKSASDEYLVTSPSSFMVYVVAKEEGAYQVKPFAGTGEQGTTDGTPSLSSFNRPKGIAIDSKNSKAFVGDLNCGRVITVQVYYFFIPKNELLNLAKVGEGALGVVFRAQFQGKQVIYKQMLLLTNNEEEKRNAFAKEIAAWQNATHESCVALYGIMEEGPEFGIVCEYCPNGSLDTQFKLKMVLSAVQSIDFAVRLANAINVMHSRNLVHHDINSANIMLDQNMKPKLGDFGTAKLLQTIQGSHIPVGNFNYMAPEIIDNSIEDPFLCDVYSFGVLMHEFATSTVVATRKVAPVFEKPEGFSKEAREMWWQLSRDCTQTNPKDRPVMGSVVATLNAINKMVLGIRCKKHGKSTHKVYISYRAATDRECLPDGEDWEKCLLYGLQNCRSIVPIISAAGWERMKVADKNNDNLLREYEHVFKMLKNNQQVEVFPWIVGPTPKLNSFPEAPHLFSKLPIRTTLEKVLEYPSISKERNDVEQVAEMLMEKIKKTKGKEKEMQKQQQYNVADSNIANLGFRHEMYRPRLLQLKGKRHIRVQEVPLTYKSLNSGDVFLLDGGKTVIQWNGSSAGILEKTKGAELLQALKGERGGDKISGRVVSQAEDDAEFFKILGDKGPIASASAGGSDLEADKQGTGVVLLRLSDASGKLEFDEVAKGVKINRIHLNSNDVFILFTGAEVFAWVGKNASVGEKKKALSFAQEYVKKANLPPNTPVARILEGGKNEVFEYYLNDN